MTRNTKPFKWKCGFCDDVIESNPLITHQMDYCKCGKSSVDAEEYYTRMLGEPIMLEGLKNGLA